VVLCALSVSSCGFLPAARTSLRSISRVVMSTAEGAPPAALEWKPQGHSFWQWRASPVGGPGSRVHYIAAGPEDAPPLVLVHGFGASWYHWRYNVPELARTYRVYAVDLLGFGLTDKPLIDYTSDVWAGQLCDFIREVVAPGAPCKAMVAGNSLGGFATLAAAVRAPDLIQGIGLLNAAGRFSDDSEANAQGFIDKVEEPIMDWATSVREALASFVQRGALFLSFQLTKQPARIKQVLQQVYTVSDANVDDALVESIRAPAEDKDAAEVFYRIVSRNAVKPSTTINQLLAQLDESVDVLLLWGELDPWIRPAAADRIQRLRPGARRVSLNAGHCPHDEVPTAVNQALAQWVAGRAATPSQGTS